VAGGHALAEDLWSPPIFFPVRDVAFYTDLLLGVAPLYWPWRWLGAGPETSYQLWMLTIWSLNFAAPTCCFDGDCGRAPSEQPLGPTCSASAARSW